MCGRFVAKIDADLERAWDLVGSVPLFESYNIAPTQTVPVVLHDETASRVCEPMRWGLVPFWAKDRSIGNRMINARSETVAEKPAFRAAYRSRRCLVPASGYYEWKREGKVKQPFFIHPTPAYADSPASANRPGPFAFAGLWERWTDPDGGTELRTFTLLTTEAAGKAASVHHRMPVILDTEGRKQWLDCTSDAALLAACDDAWLDLYPVSTRVNNARNDAPENLDPIA